jgi:hypothetical protein
MKSGVDWVRGRLSQGWPKGFSSWSHTLVSTCLCFCHCGCQHMALSASPAPSSATPPTPARLCPCPERQRDCSVSVAPPVSVHWATSQACLEDSGKWPELEIVFRSFPLLFHQPPILLTSWTQLAIRVDTWSRLRQNKGTLCIGFTPLSHRLLLLSHCPLSSS